MPAPPRRAMRASPLPKSRCLWYLSADTRPQRGASFHGNDLARNPFRGRMCCDADPDQLSAIQPHYDVGVEQVEANGRDNEQVHGGDCGSLLRWRLSLTLSSSAHFWTISLEKLLS